jgi:hypothetical protein
MPAIQTKGFTNPPSLSSPSIPPKIRKLNATTTRQSQPSPQKHLRKAYPSRPATYALRVYRLLPRSHQTLKVGNMGMAPKRKPCKPGDGHVGQMSRSPWAITVTGQERIPNRRQKIFHSRSVASRLLHGLFAKKATALPPPPLAPL